MKNERMKVKKNKTGIRGTKLFHPMWLVNQTLHTPLLHRLVAMSGISGGWRSGPQPLAMAPHSVEVRLLTNSSSRYPTRCGTKSVPSLLGSWIEILLKNGRFLQKMIKPVGTSFAGS
jgi:hypothetical protein